MLSFLHSDIITETSQTKIGSYAVRKRPTNKCKHCGTSLGDTSFLHFRYKPDDILFDIFIDFQRYKA